MACPCRSGPRNGLQRRMVDFDTAFSVHSGLLVLPEGFRMVTLETGLGEPR